MQDGALCTKFSIIIYACAASSPGRKSEKARKFEELCTCVERARELLKEGEVFLGVLFCLAFSLCARLCPCAQPVCLASLAVPSASALGFVGPAFSQCARLRWPSLQPVR